MFAFQVWFGRFGLVGLFGRFIALTSKLGLVWFSKLGWLSLVWFGRFALQVWFGRFGVV